MTKNDLKEAREALRDPSGDEESFWLHRIVDALEKLSDEQIAAIKIRSLDECIESDVAIKEKDMTKLTRTFVAEWIALEARGRAIDFERAMLVSRWNKKLGAETVSGMLKTDVGLGPPRMLKLAKQVEALTIISDRKVWEAIGWGWVSRLSDIATENERNRIQNALMEAADLAGGVLQDGAVKTVLRTINAEAMLPKTKAIDAAKGDTLFRHELERLVRSGILAIDKVDPYVVKVGRLAELATVDA